MAQERPLFEEMTLRQLRKWASKYNIPRYSRMRKQELLFAIQKANLINKIAVAPSQPPIQEKQKVEAAKFELKQEDFTSTALSDVDEGLGELPENYTQSSIVLLARDSQWAYTYWNISEEDKEKLRRQGGQNLALRIYDVTNIDLDYQASHNVQEYLCDELAQDWYLSIPVSDRDYLIEIGYVCQDGRWLMLARSTPVHIPPLYPSEWIEDNFVTVDWDEELSDSNAYSLVRSVKTNGNGTRMGKSAVVYEQIFDYLGHVPGSINPQKVVSSHIFPSDFNLGNLPTLSGLNMSGIGFSASAPPLRPRQFWLVADAELIIYGATEPNATLTIGGRPLKLNPDGTFRFQIAFPDGLIDYPIMAVATDGEQTRSIHLKFNRETPSRNTNTQEQALEELTLLS